MKAPAGKRASGQPRPKKTAPAPFAPPDWPAAKVEMWRLDKIIPYEKNPRTHPEAQVALLAQSMKDEGVTMPILVDEAGVILAGHGRRLAAMRNQFEEYPVVVARGWTEEQKRAARIKDNSIGLMSGWDRDMIRAEITSLQSAGYEVALLGFGDAQLVQFTTSPQPPDEFPEFGENIATEHQCPKCGYKFSGGSKAKADGKS